MMDKKEIEKRVIEILVDKLGPKAEKLKPESKLIEDLGMDSFNYVEIIYELEQAFNIKVPNEIIPKIKTVRDIMNSISRYTHK